MGDKRVEKTLGLIKSSYLKLCRVTPPEKISVKNICDDANINRGTFYKYYMDMPDLRYKLESQAAQRISQFITQNYTFDGTNTNTAAEAMFLYIKENPDDAELLFGKHNASNTDSGMSLFYEYMWKAAFPNWLKKSSMSENELSLVFGYTINSIYYFLEVWQQGVVSISEERFKALYNEVITQGIIRPVYHSVSNCSYKSVSKPQKKSDSI